jgi:hypothetical protein
MDARIQRLSVAAEHAYGVVVRGHLVAHTWWDADPGRRDAAGWYMRDLRTPAIVVRLTVADGAVEALAADVTSPDDAWADTAADVARRSTPIALEEAQYAIRDSPFECYDVHVGGLEHDALAASFPGLGVRPAGEVEVVSGRLDNSQLADVLGCVRSLGGVVTAVVRVRPGLR